MTEVIVTFCNNYRRYPDVGKNLGLAKVNVTTGKFEAIHLPAELEINGCTGIAKTSCSYFVCGQSNPNQLIELTESLEFLRSTPLLGLRGVHTLLPYGKSIIAAATGSDRVVEIVEDTFRVLWSAPESNGTDKLHINSVAQSRGRLACSMFGATGINGWNEAKDGAVFYIDDGEIISSVLTQPHSLIFHNQTPVFAESGTSRLFYGDRRIPFGFGYPRGIVTDNNRMYVGSSIRRQWSESSGAKLTRNNPEGHQRVYCGIATYQIEPGNQEPTLLNFVNLGELANEIFEIALPL